MFEKLYSPLPDTEKYLKRINYHEPVKADKATLDGLVYAHLCTVPFENLDIFDYGLDISLDIDRLFDKVVTKKRGGYCFELNALFMSLLQSVGFECHAVSARVLWNKDYFTPPGHRITVVAAEGKTWYADVGFGGPTPSAGVSTAQTGAFNTPGGQFSFEPDGDSVVMSRITGGRYEHVLMIDKRPSDPVDFVPLNHYFSKSDESYFKSKRMVNLSTPEGSISIDGDILRIHRGVHVEESMLITEEERLFALSQNFGLELSG